MAKNLKTNYLTGAEAMVKLLDGHGVKYIFGLCGDTSLPFYDALYRLNHSITHILTRDERHASYMADAYARVTGNVGICEGPSGGGATYIIPGVVEANESSIGLISLTSDVSLSSIGHFPLTELKQKEPNLNCYSGLYCTKEGSTNYGLLTKAISELSKKNGTNFLLEHNVKHVEETSKEVNIIFSDNSSLTANFAINCAGGNSLDVAKKFRLLKGYSDLHFRGEYWVADSDIANLVKTNIYTVPRYPEFPFLDPHWIKRANGETEIGPNAVPVDSPEAYDSFITDIPTVLSKITDIVTGSTKKLLLNTDFISLVSKEFLSSISKSAMVERVKKFIPAIKPENFPKRGTAGIRTPVISPEGNFVSEMIEIEGKNSFHVVNYNTPGATGAPAYSAFVVKKLQEKGILTQPKNQKDSIWNFNEIIGQA